MLIQTIGNDNVNVFLQFKKVEFLMAITDIEKIKEQIESIDIRGKKTRKLGEDYNLDKKEFDILRKKIEDSDLSEIDKIEKVKELNEQYKYHLEAYKTHVKSESENIISEKQKEIRELRTKKVALHKAAEKLNKVTFVTDTGSISQVQESLKKMESYAEQVIKQSESQLEEYKRLATEEETEMGCYNFDRTNLTLPYFEEKLNLEPLNQQYVADLLSVLEKDLPKIIDKDIVRAGAEVRKMRTPKIKASTGEIKGTWENSVFYLDDNFVPKRANKEKLTVAEIKQQLNDSFHIKFDGIPFTNGAADFRSISVATISKEDIVLELIEMSKLEYNSMQPIEKTKKLREVFDENKRKSNFTLADKIAAKKGIHLPGLAPPYTASELANWREDKKFTWDEQVNVGYNLVPMSIHENISHTGLVGSLKQAVKYLKQREDDGPTKYSWKEEDAPISLEEFYKKYKKKP